MRISRSAYARVQSYFPECSVVVEDLEAHVQAAELQMFPQKKAEQEEWLKVVVQAMMPKVELWGIAMTECCAMMGCCAMMCCDEL